jgi:hypothetical protein
MSGAAHEMFMELGATLLVTTARPHDDPALESFRRLFGHLLESFEVLMASRLLQSSQSPRKPSRS